MPGTREHEIQNTKQETQNTNYKIHLMPGTREHEGRCVDESDQRYGSYGRNGSSFRQCYDIIWDLDMINDDIYL